MDERLLSVPKPGSRQGLLAPVLPCPGRAVLQTVSCPWSEIAGIFGFLYHLVFPPRAVIVQRKAAAD